MSSLQFGAAPLLLAQDKASLITIEVAPQLQRRAISDLIYGINDLDNRLLNDGLNYPLKRWGGSSLSRYNWQANATNLGSDWYFLNHALPYHDAASFSFPGSQKLSASDIFVWSGKRRGMEPLMTIPMLGWVAKDRDPSWAYAVSRYGPQQSVEKEQSNGDAGTGVKRDGQMIHNNRPEDTSMRVGPAYVAQWVQHFQTLLQGKQAKSGGLRFYALDHEPTLWHETHRDIRVADPFVENPQLGYDELWERTVLYASAIKRADPEAQVLGPVAWGWCAYFTSARDLHDAKGSCLDGDDRRRHGGLPFLEWYLRQACQYQQDHGMRLIDFLDVHYYPQDELDPRDEGAASAQRRLASVRSLHDPEYRDPSWIDANIHLIPRLRSWIDRSCPGTKLALSEWRFGNNINGISSSIATAEAMAIFGREGVDLAAWRGTASAGSLLESAFRVFLDYDGKGSHLLGGTSVKASSSDATSFPAYAIERGKQLFILLFNKSEQSRRMMVKLSGNYQTLQWFSLASNRPLTQGGKGAVRDGSFTLDSEALSLNMAVLTQDP